MMVRKSNSDGCGCGKPKCSGCNKYRAGGMLTGGQKRLDKNSNGKIDANDFELLRKYMSGGMIKDYMPGGMVKKYVVGGLLNGDPTKKEASNSEGLELLARRRGGTAYGTTADVARGDDMGGFTTAVDNTAVRNMAIALGLGEPEAPEAPRPGERMEPVAMRPPRVIRNRTNKELVGERQDIPEREKEKDYGFRVMRDPDQFRHPYGKSITTRSTGEETDTSGMMGVRMGNTAYYMPNSRGYTGPKGKLVRDFREIKDKFGEEAYMQALGMLQEQGADISRLID